MADAIVVDIETGEILEEVQTPAPMNFDEIMASLNEINVALGVMEMVSDDDEDEDEQ